jgi:hypothetical protein
VLQYGLHSNNASAENVWKINFPLVFGQLAYRRTSRYWK